MSATTTGGRAARCSEGPRGIACHSSPRARIQPGSWAPLMARVTMAVSPTIPCTPLNENDAIADEEIRFGDNDRLSALVSHLIGADLLVLLTDTPGLLTADPRLDASASLIEEIVEFDQDLVRRAGGAGTARGS